MCALPLFLASAYTNNTPQSSHHLTHTHHQSKAASKLIELACLHPDRRLAEAAAAALVAELPQEAQYFDRCVDDEGICVGACV